MLRNYYLLWIRKLKIDWTAQQIVEAFPFDTAPSYLIRDGDGINGERVTRRIESLGVDLHQKLI